MKYAFVLLCSLSLFFHSCHPVDKQPCGDVKCMKVGLKMQLAGYADSSFETMYLNTYEEGNNFTNPISTKTLHSEDAPVNEKGVYGARLMSGLVMDAGYSYELILSSTNDTLRVWDVEAPADTVKIECGTKGCYAFTRACKTNKDNGNWNISPAAGSQDMSVVFFK